MDETLETLVRNVYRSGQAAQAYEDSRMKVLLDYLQSVVNEAYDRGFSNSLSAIWG